jgi:hypothetical protein
MVRVKCLLVLAICAGTLLMPATSQAAPATNVSAFHYQRYVGASWTNPADRVPAYVEISTDSTFPAAATDRENVDPTAVDFLSQVERARTTTYYVRVAVKDPACTTNCAVELSDFSPVTIPDAPKNLTVSQTGGVVSASWALPTNWWTGVLDFSLKRDVDPSDGYFSDPDTSFVVYVDGPDTSFVAPAVLPPGTYYVHVSGYDSTCTTVCEPEQFSEIASVTIPQTVLPPPTGGGGGQQQQVKADKSTSFSALKCSTTQKASKLSVQVAMPENGTVTVGGTISVPNASKVYKLKTLSVKTLAAKTLTIKVKLPKKVRKAVKRGLKKHRKVKANLTITARDLAGNKKVEKRSVRLK